MLRRRKEEPSAITRIHDAVIIDAMSLQLRADRERLDYHKLVASEYFHKPYKRVTSTEREQMKQMLFHEHYGMSGKQFVESLKASLPVQLPAQSQGPWMCACRRAHPPNRYRCKKCRQQSPYRRGTS